MARAIGEALGVTGKGRSYLQGEVDGQRTLITWCVGHLVRLVDAGHYGKKAWTFSNMPILPQPFCYEPEPRTLDQFEAVRGLMLRDDVTEIVNATDAGREGQLIFHLVYDLAASHKPIKRFWTSALTEDAIRHAWRGLRDDSEFAGLTAAAHCRQQADWLVGINCTRAQTLVAQARGAQGVHSVGRVQTPTLAILVRRELEIARFEPKDFWQLIGHFRTEDGRAYAGKWFAPRPDGEAHDRFDTVQEAEALRLRLLGGQAHVQQVDKKIERRKPELLYDLTALQREANKRFGYTAEATLEIAQQLYEAQLISYPRTNSRFLTQEDAAKAPTWLSALDRGPWAPAVGWIRGQGKDGAPPPMAKRFVDDKEVEDHSALTVTNKAVRLNGGEVALPPDQFNIYDLIARRLLSTWYGDRVAHKTTAITAVQPADGGKPELFRTHGTVVTDAGWTAIDQPRRGPAKELKEAKEGDEDAELPPLRRGEVVQLVDVASKPGKTTPPKPLTEADLLAAMQGAGKLIDDELLRGAMKDCGLGTPATRAAIIETLLKRGFAARRGKNLVATPAGIELIEGLPVEALKSPELTGQWEAEMEQIRRGHGDKERFMASIRAFAAAAVDGMRAAGRQAALNHAQSPENRGPACPDCAAPMVGQNAGDTVRWRCAGLLRADCRGGYETRADGSPLRRCPHCQGALRGRLEGQSRCVRCGRPEQPAADRPPWPALQACPQCRRLLLSVWSAKKNQWLLRCGPCDVWQDAALPSAAAPAHAPPCPKCRLPMAATWSRQKGAWLWRCLDCATWQIADATSVRP